MGKNFSYNVEIWSKIKLGVSRHTTQQMLRSLMPDSQLEAQANKVRVGILTPFPDSEHAYKFLVVGKLDKRFVFTSTAEMVKQFLALPVIECGVLEAVLLNLNFLYWRFRADVKSFLSTVVELIRLEIGRCNTI